MSDVRLVDLDLFKRYSLAIRQESAPVEEVLAILDVTRRQVLAAAGLPDETWAPAAGPGREAEAGWGGVEEWAREEQVAEAAAWAALDETVPEEAESPPPPPPEVEAEAEPPGPAAGRRGARRKATVSAPPAWSSGTADEATWGPGRDEPASPGEPPADEPRLGGDEPGTAAAARRRRTRPTDGDGGGAATVRRRR